MAYPNTLNSCRFIGRLGRDPEMRYTPSGSALLKFSIAVDEYSKNADGTRKQVTHWVPLIAWGRQAELLNTLVKKGTLVSVDAKYETQQYEKDGEKRYSHDFVVVAFNILGNGKSRDESASEDTGDGAGYNEGDDLPF